MYNFHLKFLGAIRSPLSPLPSHLQMQHLQKAFFDILPPLHDFFYFCPTQTNLLCQLFVPTRSQKYSCVSRLCDNDSCNFVRLNKIFPFLSHLSHLSTNRQMSTKPRWSPRSPKKKSKLSHHISTPSGVAKTESPESMKLTTINSLLSLYTLHSPLQTAYNP